jgi:hypothetical protein
MQQASRRYSPRRTYAAAIIAAHNSIVGRIWGGDAMEHDSKVEGRDGALAATAIYIVRGIVLIAAVAGILIYH